jgi:hypothetical protein
MEYSTDYIIVEGDKETFENRINSLSIQGYIWCGNMNTNFIEGVVYYSQLVSKLTPN